jgi:class 3 adenylate cyclase
VKAAIEIRDFVAQEAERKGADNPASFEVRIGIHSGPVVSGVVGTKKFAFDIWGDTVNTASRMETNSEASRINVSGSTHELIKDTFNCEYRGKVPAKNKGEIDMYYIEQTK